MPDRTIDIDTIKAALDRALRRLVDEDTYLFEVDSSERSLTFRLGLYLHEEFRAEPANGESADEARFHVDGEYNRSVTGLKQLAAIRSLLLLADPTSKTKGAVFPDIIIHRSGPTGPNLLAIESKKRSTLKPKQAAFDRAKLKAYRSELEYRVAAFIVFGRAGEFPEVDYLET